MPTTNNERILIGTASWSDPGFVERWYPSGMPAGERLRWYAEHFEMVEVNSTFYAVPEARMVERWCRSTPDGFTFNVKLHQLLSRHATLLKLLPPALQKRAETDAKGKVKLTGALEEEMAQLIRGAVEPLRASGRLGALLLQLSPAFSPRKHDLTELENLLRAFQGMDLAVEFRNRNWAIGEQLPTTLEFLRRNGATLVKVDAPNEPHFTIMPPELDAITNPQLAYLRLHGRDAKAYLTGKTVAARFNYDYNDEEIAEIATRSQKLAREAAQVHVVFNNNALDYAPRAAMKLREALQQVLPKPRAQPELFA